jgi:hypothetical protein
MLTKNLISGKMRFIYDDQMLGTREFELSVEFCRLVRAV